jgi:serine/threonine protein kinase
MSADHPASDPTSPDPDKDGSIDRSINFTDHHSPSEQSSDSLNSGTDNSDSQSSERWDSQSMDSQPRTNVAQYHIEGQIGGGVMTVVYRARDTLLDRMVALKVLLQGADETTRERFSQEARTAAMLEHPNIVRTYQVGQMPETGQSYIAMELVNGPSVAELLERHPILECSDAAALL